MKKYSIGLVVGKFAPLHKGHELVINTAFEQSETVVIISYTSSDLGYPAHQRRDWLETRFPRAYIDVKESDVVPDDDAPDIEHRLFCAKVCESIQMIPDAVFTSELYGDGFARVLSERWEKKVDHVMVDLHRVLVPISGTVLRSNDALWERFVHSDVRGIR